MRDSIVSEYFGGEDDPPPPEEKSPSSVPLDGRSRKGSAKTAEAVNCECEAMVEEFGVKRTVFVTLTFAHGIFDIPGAQKAWKYFRDKWLDERIDRGIFVFERHRSGAIHLHGLCVPKGMDDLQGDFDHVAFERARRASGLTRLNLTGRYSRSATNDLKTWWAMLRAPELAERFQIGRCESTPLKSYKGAARYVAKYVNKPRDQRDAGARLVRFLGYRDADGNSLRKRLSSGWAWCTKGGALSRVKLAWAAAQMKIPSMEMAAQILGRHWGFALMTVGKLMPLAAVPSHLLQYEIAKRSRSAVHAAGLVAEAERVLGAHAILFDFESVTPFAAY